MSRCLQLKRRADDEFGATRANSHVRGMFSLIHRVGSLFIHGAVQRRSLFLSFHRKAFAGTPTILVPVL